MVSHRDRMLEIVRREEDGTWCGPDVVALSDHVCFFDGAPADAPRRTRSR